MGLNLHRLYSTILAGGKVLPGISRRELNFNSAHIAVRAAGSLFSSFVAMQRQAPIVPVTTTDISILNDTKCTGKAYSASDAITLWAAKQDDSGRNDPTNVHTKAVSRKGNLVPMQLQARGDDAATVGLEFHAVKTPNNAIWAFTDGLSLPGGTPTVDELYKLAGETVKFNGDVRDGVQGVSVAFNAQTNPEKIAGEVAPSQLFVTHGLPVIEFMGRNVADWLDTDIGPDGLAVSGWSFFLRAFKNDEEAWDDTDPKHIKIYGTKGLLYPTTLGGGLDEPQSSGLRFVPRQDSTPEPVLFAINQQIS